MRALQSCLQSAGRSGRLAGALRHWSAPRSGVAPRLPAPARAAPAAGRRQGILLRTRATVAAPQQQQEAMVAQAPQPVYRKDYAPTPYRVEHLHLDFQLNDDVTRVTSRLSVSPAHGEGPPPPLVLDGRADVKLVSVAIGGETLPDSAFTVTDKQLTIAAPPAGAFELRVEVDIKPQENTMLEGLYMSGGSFCTQCEAEGFRGITYFYDRPDVMAKYTVRLEAEKAKYPVLLSNGNLIDSGEAGSRHFTVWEDPFPKPSYLFALVAGDLQSLEDSFTTKSGRQVKLRLWTAAADLPKTEWAMASLKKAMKWDEDVFGLEYHLDKFDVVCMHDFNSGAMENTSLNIFNSRLVLASSDTATDADYARIEGVVAHEYFHNWTGNRVTCRDWFQLTLKEGLTVFRDQEFSSDMNSRAVKRIEDVCRLRQAQFPEDAGAMAHPIRPDSYVRMDNFYSVTVYEKGAEVIRLYHTLLGKDGFRKGMDLYFKRHDGQAVTCDDFLAAMADANGADLSGLKLWYAQAGTPEVTVEQSYNSAARTLTLTASQRTPPTPGQAAKQPLLIPLRTALLAADGSPIPLRLQGGSGEPATELVLRLEQASQSFTFTEVPEQPVLSILRDFSAPVKLDVAGQTREQLLFLLARDSDAFSRWEAGQRLQRSLLLALYVAATAGSPAKGGELEGRLAGAGGVPDALIEAFRSLLTDEGADPALVAAAVSLPAASELLNAIPSADPVALHEVRKYVTRQLAQRLRPELEAAVTRADAALRGPYSPAPAAAARRSLKNRALTLLAAAGDPKVHEGILQRFRDASNMTDEVAAVSALVDTDGPEREAALDEFYARWKGEPLVVLKWLALKAGSNAPGNVAAARELKAHPAFNVRNPNSCYSLFFAFARSHPNFHAADGSGYEFLADSVIEVDRINRSVAARLAGAFTQWKQLDAGRQALMQAQIRRILAVEGVSENLYEVCSKSL